ncbi:MAG TPA: four helix bundle protein [Gemmatimonadales bacterium]
MQRFRDLLVWQKSRELTKRVYELTRNFPASERFGLVSQLRRAAVSIMSNIAEGSRRLTPRDYAHFLNIAEGSAAEIEPLMVTSQDQGCLDDASSVELSVVDC